MFITVDELKDYTGLNTDSATLPAIFCDAACDVVSDYLGYNPEASTKFVTAKIPAEKTVALGVMNAVPVSVKIGETEIPLDEVIIDGQYLKFTSKSVCVGDEVAVMLNCGWEVENMPGIIKLTALRIAGCMATESDGNIGISSKSFSESGSRVFLNQKYDRYLEPIERYRAYKI